jgi:hypothetical protein
LVHLRFIEMTSGTIQESGEVRPDGEVRPEGTPARRRERDERDGVDGPPRLPAGAPIVASDPNAPTEPEPDLDIDEDFLRRVRDV